MNFRIHVVLSLLLMIVSSGCAASKETRVAGDLKVLAGQLNLYYRLTRKHPTTEEGLQALVTRPASASTGWRSMLLEIPLDPWARPYQYSSDGRSFDVFSLGPNPQDASDNIRFTHQ